MPKPPSLEEENEEITEAAHDDATEKHRTRTRSSHHKHSQRGRLVILLMVSLVVAHWGIRGYLSSIGHVHPLTITWNIPVQTVILMNAFFTALGLICLFLLYRGNLPMRWVFGAVSTIAAVFYAIVLGWGLMAGLPLMWTAYNVLALAASGLAAWACLMSKTAARFLTYQENRH